MTTFTEGTHAGEFIISESHGTRSRQAVTLASGQDLVACTVLGQLTADSTYTQFDQDAVATGAQIASAVLLDACDASAAAAPCVVIARDAEINAARLIWPSDITAGEITAALAQLAAVGIIAR